LIDLHTHTAFSDGTTTPEENAMLAVAAGLTALALPDHDPPDGWARMAAACAAHGLVFVPGIELSAELDGASVHVLGYGMDPAHPAFAAECARLRTERDRRARLMTDRLAALGLPVTWAMVQAHAGGAPVGRPHLGAALVEAGVVADLDAAFDHWLGEDGPVHEPKRALDPVAAVGLIRAAGGAAVLAHPGTTFGLPAVADAVLDALTDAGLAGLETDHPAHDPALTATWRLAAERRGLLATGSSDFHGGRKSVRIGERATPTHVVDALAESTRGGTRW
jgi:predicted metal-dependent phosphoesterase TrpH